MANFQNEREQLAQLEWLFQQKQFAEGLARTETVLGQFPASFHLKFLKYRFLNELQQFGEALQLLRQMHAMAGDNIMVLKALADLHFTLKQFPESLLYYQKLLFLDSFNGLAQERVKLLQGMLESGVSDRLADTKAEFRPEIPPAPPSAEPEIEVESPIGETILNLDEEATAAPDAKAASPADTAPATGPDPDAEYFQTASAAELYLQQGHRREALAIYKSLFEKTGRAGYFQKINAILQLQRSERGARLIGRLQGFLQLLQQRGSQIV